jgi:hypothetical protein
MSFGGDDDDGEGDQRHSEISCAPNCSAPKLLVGVVRVDNEHGKTLYVLKLQLVGSSIEWMVKRRYSEFLELRDEVYHGFMRRNVNQCFGCRWFYNSLRDFGFPRKHLVSSKEQETIRFRKNRLDRFARLLTAHTFSAIPKCVQCRETPFCRIRNFFTANALLPSHVTPKQLEAALVPERFAAISDPLKSKIEFRRGHGIFRVFQVEKPILVQWSEIEAAKRTKRLQRRYSSTSRLTPPCQISEGDDGLDEEKPAVPLLMEGGEKDELEGAATESKVVATDNAVPLQPLAYNKRTRTTETNASRWDRWELASPTHSAAKQA